MTKKIISALTAIICAASACVAGAVSVSAEKTSATKTSGNLKYVVVDEDEDGNDDFVRITGCNSSAETLSIPITIDDLVVKEVLPSSFLGNSVLNRIEVSNKNEYFDASDEGILFTEGGKELVCFPCALSKTSYNIPGSVISIGDYAFQSCEKLTNVTIPTTVESIGNYAFAKCKGLADIKIPKSVESVGMYAFNGTEVLDFQIRNNQGPLYYADSWLIGSESKIDNVMSDSNAIKDGTTGIAGGVFYNCQKLTKVEIPSSVLYISEGAFMDCDALANISIPSSVKKMGDGVFSDCDGLVELSVPNNVKEYGIGIFANCSKLAKINIPTGLSVIPESAFEGCGALVSIDIPANISKIEKLAFYNCGKLSTVTIRNKNCEITNAPQTFSNNDKSYDGTICGHEGSKANEYAIRYNRIFEALNGTAAGMLGDANGDGIVNVRDAAYIATMLAKGKEDSLPEEADYNGDGQKNVRDAAAIATALAKGKI